MLKFTMTALLALTPCRAHPQKIQDCTTGTRVHVHFESRTYEGLAVLDGILSKDLCWITWVKDGSLTSRRRERLSLASVEATPQQAAVVEVASQPAVVEAERQRDEVKDTTGPSNQHSRHEQ